MKKNPEVLSKTRNRGSITGRLNPSEAESKQILFGLQFSVAQYILLSYVKATPRQHRKSP